MRYVKAALFVFVGTLIFLGGAKKTPAGIPLSAAKTKQPKQRFLIRFASGTPLAERRAFFVKNNLMPVAFDVFGYDIGEGTGSRKIQGRFVLDYEVEAPEKSSALRSGGCMVQVAEDVDITKNNGGLVSQWYEKFLGVKSAHKFLAERRVKLHPEGIVIIDVAPALAHPDIGPALKRHRDGRAIIWTRMWNLESTRGHGTYISCLAAGYHDNHGMEGVAGPSAYILPVMLDHQDTDYFFSSDIALGLKYYAELERKGEVSFHVVNMSMGFFHELKIVKAAIAGLPDKLFVVSASNEHGRNIDKVPVYPASWPFPNILAVAATDKDDRLAALSNIGPKRIEIAAPGEHIVSCGEGLKYEFRSGTSASAAIVSGAATLLHAMSPDLSLSATKDYLFRGADRLSALQGKVAGARRLNVWKSVKLLWDSENTK